MAHTFGEMEYLCYQEFGGYDLIRVSGKLSIYKKKILQRATQVENVYGLDPDACSLQYKLQKKDKKNKESKKDKYSKNAPDAPEYCTNDPSVARDVPFRAKADNRQLML